MSGPRGSGGVVEDWIGTERKRPSTRSVSRDRRRNLWDDGGRGVRSHPRAGAGVSIHSVRTPLTGFVDVP